MGWGAPAGEGKESVREGSQAAPAVPGECGEAALLPGTAQAGTGTHSCFVLCELCPVELGTAGARETQGSFSLSAFHPGFLPPHGELVILASKWGKLFVVHQSLMSGAVAKMFLPPAGPLELGVHGVISHSLW